MKKLLLLGAALLSFAAASSVQAVDIPDCDNHCMMFMCIGYGNYPECVRHCKEVLCCEGNSENFC